MKDANLFGTAEPKKRKSRRWTPEGVAIYVFGSMSPDPVAVTVPIVGNKLETRWACVDTDRTLHLVAESERFGLNAVGYAKRFAKVGFDCRCYVGTLDDKGFFLDVAKVVKRTAAEKRAMKKLGVRN